MVDKLSHYLPSFLSSREHVLPVHHPSPSSPSHSTPLRTPPFPTAQLRLSTLSTLTLRASSLRFPHAGSHRWRFPSPCRLFRWERNGGQIAHRQWRRCKRSKVCLPCFPAYFPLFSLHLSCYVLGSPSTSRVRYNLSASFYRATIPSPKFKVNADLHILPLDYPVVSLTRRAAPRLP